MLLILTSDKDFTADFLIVELINRRLPYFRLNSEELATAGYTFALAGDAVRRAKSLSVKEPWTWPRSGLSGIAGPSIRVQSLAFRAARESSWLVNCATSLWVWC
jgi:hypothetical protein